MGKCANCGAGRGNSKWNSRKGGHAVDSLNKENLPFLSSDNNRVCHPCYLARAPASTQKNPKPKKCKSAPAHLTRERAVNLSSRSPAPTLPPTPLAPQPVRLLLFRVRIPDQKKKKKRQRTTGRGKVLLVKNGKVPVTPEQLEAAWTRLGAGFTHVVPRPGELVVIPQTSWVEYLRKVVCCKAGDNGGRWEGSPNDRQRSSECEGSLFCVERPIAAEGRHLVHLRCDKCLGVWSFESRPVERVDLRFAGASANSPGFSLPNVLGVLSAVATGMSYTQYHTSAMMNGFGSTSLSDPAFCKLKTLILNVATDLSKECMDRTIKELKDWCKKNGKGAVVSTDFGWSQKRNAFAGWEVVLWEGKVLGIIVKVKPRTINGEVVVEGNTDGGSSGMEGEAFIEMIEELLGKNGLLEPINPPPEPEQRDLDEEFAGADQGGKEHAQHNQSTCHHT